MYAKLTSWENRIGKTPYLYGNLERTFYAFKMNQTPPGLADMWNPNNKTTKPFVSSGFTYFILNTMVGIGAKKEKVRRVHIRFALIPMDMEVPRPEVVSIYPNYISRVVGVINSVENIERQKQYGLKGKSSAGISISDHLQTGGTAFLNIFRKTSATKKITATLPNEVLITNASGAGIHATWEFYRGEGVQEVGQYDLEIIFRIYDFNAEKILGKGHYCIDWNIEVNGRKLIDHDYDCENAFWNIEVNGRKLMDHTDDNKVKWNIEVKKKEIETQEDYEKRRWGLIVKDEPEADKRLLRPLYLVNTGNDDSLVSFLNKQG